MKKLLIFCPHLSTGGAPQVTANKVKLLKDEFDLIVVEHSMIAWNYVVQRNDIIKTIGKDKFFTLGENKEKDFKAIMENFNPDVISMEEFPEMFLEGHISDWLYRPDRPYTIFETTHDSSFSPKAKIYFPDKFIYVSAYCAFKYNEFTTPAEIIEYPIDNKARNKHRAREVLGLEPDYKHVVIVGLFTPRKNQKYAFELAERVHKHKIKFHFIGNQADNFSYYWKPLNEWKQSSEKMNNVVIWGERPDVLTFMEASDMFLFCSKGDKHNKELNPIAIKEAMEYDIPKLMYNLDVYCNKYHQFDNVHELTGDLNLDTKKMLEIFKIDEEALSKEAIIIGTYPNLKEREELTKECIKRLKALNRKIILLSHYPVDFETQKMVDFYIFDAHNPLTHHSYYTKFYNYTNGYDVDININSLKGSNQSLTVLTNLFNGYKCAKANGIERAFYLTFDVLVTENDLKSIETSFESVRSGKSAYLATLNTPFKKGIQTNGMTFDVEFFLKTFHDVRNQDEYNSICSSIGSQNFLEDYLIKALKNIPTDTYELINNDQETFLLESGLGTSSNSEYYSIIPIEGEDNTFMFYFFSYNLDERKVNIKILEGGIEFFNTRFQVNKSREYKKEIKFSGSAIDFELDFYDGERLYKSEKYSINNSNLDKYKSAGIFKWKNRKPKIRLVHIQTTLNDEREQQSRLSLQKVTEYGWEYVLHTNTPYADTPPKHNCFRPNCVSNELFDDEMVSKYGTALTPAHYGCYESFKNAILSEFTNEIDFLIVCEGDCLIEIPTKEFVQKVESSCDITKKYNIGFMSFGDKETLEHGWMQSPVVQEIPEADFMYVTNHIIGLQCIMFPKFTKDYLKTQLRTHKWDAADMYFNLIMSASPYKMGIVKNRLTTQADGYSLIDKTVKTFRKK
jgi:glycosyltransferase involved in cell wall biosynthesis